MTILGLQDALIEDIEDILSEIKTTNTANEVVTGVKGFRHNLPMIESDEDDVSEHFPFFIVRLNGGETASDEDVWHVDVSIIFGVHDETPEGGHEHVVIMCQRVLDRYAAWPTIGAYRAEQKMNFYIESEDSYPYYYAALSLTFSAPKIGRRDPYA